MSKAKVRAPWVTYNTMYFRCTTSIWFAMVTSVKNHEVRLFYLDVEGHVCEIDEETPAPLVKRFIPVYAGAVPEILRASLRAWLSNAAPHCVCDYCVTRDDEGNPLPEKIVCKTPAQARTEQSASRLSQAES